MCKQRSQNKFSCNLSSAEISSQSSCKKLNLAQVVNCFERKKREIVFCKKNQVSVPVEEAEREPDYHINSSVRVRV